MTLSSSAVLALTVVIVPALMAQSPPPSAPVLLGDLNGPSSLSGSSSPSHFATVGGVAYFAADDGEAGRELFRSLGTLRTTIRLADIAAGAPGSQPQHLTPVGNRMFFFADDVVHGREPWLTDGTPAGTRLITDIVPGTDGVGVVGAIAVGDRLVFFGDGDGSGNEPWVTDGTAAGTFRLADIAPGAQSSVDGSYLRTAAVHDDGSGRTVLDFLARNGMGFAWWRTDGTVSGTAEIAVLQSGQSATVFGTAIVTGTGRVVFSSLIAGQALSYAIWSSDGTAAGTTVIATPTSPSPVISGGIGFGGEAWFVGWGDGSLFATDGTSAGSRFVSAPGPTVGLPLVSFLGEARGALWLLRSIGSGASDLLRVDRGASAAVVTGAAPFQAALSLNQPPQRSRLGDRFLVLGAGRLWAVDISQGVFHDLAAFRGVDDRHITIVSGTALFGSYDVATGTEPWRTDGRVTGTALLRDVNTTPPVGNSPESSDPHAFTEYKDRVLFAAADALGQAIWQTDGTPAGTRRIIGDIAVADRFVPFGDRLAFRGRTPTAAYELFVTDGTAAGTAQVADLNPGIADGLLADPIALGDLLVLHGKDSPTTYGLFASDGRTVQPLNSMPGSRVLGRLERIGDRVVALTSRSATGPTPYLGEVWSTDGTAAGTSLAASVPVHGPTPAPVVFAERLWFIGVDPVEGSELFATDGTTPGTGRVGVMVPGTDQTRVYALIRAGDRLFVATSHGLFVVDDLATGPVRVPVPGSLLPVTGPAGYCEVGDRLLLLTADANRFAMWTTDGTAGGTTEIVLPPGIVPTPSLIPAGGRFALFRAIEVATTRSELWVTDGTSAGTARYGDHSIVTSVQTSASPFVPTVANGLFYAPISDVRLGVEPWVIDVGATAEVVGAGCGRAGRSAALRARTAPVLGARCELAGSSSAGAAAVVLFSASPLLPTPVPSAGACSVEVAAAAFVDLQPVAITGGRFGLGLDIPADPSLVGLQVTLQALVGPTDAALGVDLTNGVMLTLGR